MINEYERECLLNIRFIWYKAGRKTMSRESPFSQPNQFSYSVYCHLPATTALLSYVSPPVLSDIKVRDFRKPSINILTFFIAPNLV